MGQNLWVTNSLGGYFANPVLSQQVRHAAQPLCRFRQFCDMKDSQGKGKGDKVEFDKISNISTAGGTLVETSTIPRNNFVAKEGTLTITEYGNGIAYTGKLEALSEFSVDNIITRVLRDDQVKVLDSAAAAQFQAAEVKYIILGTASSAQYTNGTATGTALGNLNDYHVKNVIDQLKTWNIPTYDGENYICIASVAALRGLRDDSNFIAAARYGDPERLFTGEVGKYYGCRFIEETNALDSTVGASSFGEAVFFGADAVMEGVACPEEIRYDIPKDAGRDKAIVWYGLLGFKKIWSYAAEAQEHIIHVTSV